jgi:phage FluMu gp28-like protein
LWDHTEDPDAKDKTIARQVLVKVTTAPYEAQFEELRALAKQTGARRVTIDETGPGTMFVEKAKRPDGIPNAEGIVFTNAKKEMWATTFKSDMQRRKVELAPNREFLLQIHEIERSKTESNFYRFEGRGAHDDMFWSAMLGIYGKGRKKFRITTL